MDDMNKMALHREAADADALLELRKSHTQAIERGYKLYSSLLNELTLASGDPVTSGELETLLDQSNFEMESKIRMDKLKAIYHKVISLPARIDAAKNLCDMLVMLNRMESQSLPTSKSNAAFDRINEALAKIRKNVRKNLDSIESRGQASVG
ncbi:MAG: hypothetical protein JWR68_3454 [Polaromonas sp.]|nr:hypothetical protein [Polaromonas sp.]